MSDLSVIGLIRGGGMRLTIVHPCTGVNDYLCTLAQIYSPSFRLRSRAEATMEKPVKVKYRYWGGPIDSPGQAKHIVVTTGGVMAGLTVLSAIAAASNRQMSSLVIVALFGVLSVEMVRRQSLGAARTGFWIFVVVAGASVVALLYMAAIRDVGMATTFLVITLFYGLFSLALKRAVDAAKYLKTQLSESPTLQLFD